MTLAGFIIAVAVIGVLFYAWYYFVHRNGVYNAAADNKTNATMRGTDRQRPTNSRAAFGSEVGVIGERDAQSVPQQGDLHKQTVPAPIRERMEDGALDNNSVEIGTIEGFSRGQKHQQQHDPQGTQNFASSSVQHQMRQEAEQTFNSEIGTINGANQQQQGSASQNQTFASSSVQNQKRQDAEHCFNSEVGSIGESNGTQSDRSQYDQGPVHPQTGAADMQKYSVEAGQIGELNLIDGQGNTLLPNMIPGTNGMGYYPPLVAQQTSDKQDE